MTEEKKKKIIESAGDFVDIAIEVANQKGVPHEFAAEAVKAAMLKMSLKDIAEKMDDAAHDITAAIGWLR